MRKWITRIMYLLGFLLLCYPLVSGSMQRQNQKGAVATYQADVKKSDKEKIRQIRADAEDYNNMLFQTQGAVVDNLDAGILSDENYEKLLDQSGTGIMGSIEIPKIDVIMPIYHGTSDEVLSSGAGHQRGTSLPVGGMNTHCVLTGHRGLPGAKLFTRLDEVKEGDLFFLRVLGETLAYKVNEIKVIDPDDVDVLKIEPDRDMCTLITCTPYGLNTHRLLVIGDRVPYVKSEYDRIESGNPSLRESLFASLPFLLLDVFLVSKFIERRKRKREE